VEKLEKANNIMNASVTEWLGCKVNSLYNLLPLGSKTSTRIKARQRLRVKLPNVKLRQFPKRFST
jgi:hypothetical protein